VGARASGAHGIAGGSSAVPKRVPAAPRGESLLVQARLVPKRGWPVLAGHAADDIDALALPASALALSSTTSEVEQRGRSSPGSTSLLESTLASLAAGVVSGATVLSDSTMTSLEQIAQEMDVIIAGVGTTHAHGQSEVDRARDGVTNCSAAKAYVGRYASIASSSEELHESCRDTEARLSVAKISLCSACADVVASAKPPTVSTVPKPEELETLLIWSAGYNGTFWTSKAACEAAISDHEERRRSCGAAQVKFEMAFCEYHSQVFDSCKVYESCYSEGVSTKSQVEQQVRADEAARKAQYTSAKHVQCLVQVLNASSDDQGALLQKCTQNLEVDTSMLDIYYPSTPAEEQCESAPVAEPPCTGGFVSSHYTTKSWHASASATSARTSRRRRRRRQPPRVASSISCRRSSQNDALTRRAGPIS